MSEKILPIGDTYRALVVLDECPEKPDFEGAPVVAVDFVYWSSAAVRPLNNEAEGYQNYIRDFVAHHGNDWDLLARALKIVFGATTVEQFDTRESAYFIFDPHEMFKDEQDSREGIVKGTATEFEAWVNGEVYGVVVEHLVTGNRVYDDVCRPDESFTEWEQVEAVWGFYGDYILEDRNLRETAKGIAGLPTFASTYGPNATTY